MISKGNISNYYRLAKPGIIYGNLLTALAGYLFASHWHNHYTTLIAMLIGVGLIIGGACSINNVMDKGIDSMMERTKKRAVVTGKIPPKQALIYGFVLAGVGSIVLGIFTNLLTLYVAWFGFIIYVVFYGLAKRRSVYGTLVGSLAGAVPPLGGYTAFTNFIDLAGVLLVMILVCWQLTHFYAIALYRKKEYEAAKLPVWSVVKGDSNTQLQALGFIGLFTVFAVAIFIFGYAGWVYLIAAFVIGLGWLWYAVLLTKKLNAAAWGRKIFFSSLIVILLISAALALGPILP